MILPTSDAPRREASMQPSTMEDGLEALHALGAGQVAVAVAMLAQWLGLKPSLATALVEELAARGLLERSTPADARLTSRGRQEAARVVRRRRLVESLLMTRDGYSAEAAQVIAARVAYIVPESVVDDAARLFGEPDLTPRAEPAPAWALAMRAYLVATERGDACRPPELAPEVHRLPLPDSALDRFAWPVFPLAKGEQDA